MRITRKFNSDGASFEQLFTDLMDSKVNDFINKKYTKKKNHFNKGEIINV